MKKITLSLVFIFSLFGMNMASLADETQATQENSVTDEYTEMLSKAPISIPISA